MIALRGVTHAFGDQVVLDRVDLDLPDGSVTALMGPNGSGKTTVARILLGLTTPDAGQVLGLDHVTRAAVFQDDRLCDRLTAVANVRLVLDRGVPVSAVVAELLRAGLDEPSLVKPVRDLSGGQRRRVVIVRALLAEADLVVLDEPFTGVDVQARATMAGLVRQRCAGRTVLLITPDRSEVERLGARVVNLRRG